MVKKLIYRNNFCNKNNHLLLIIIHWINIILLAYYDNRLQYSLLKKSFNIILIINIWFSTMNTVVSFQNSLKYLYTEIKQLLSIWFLMLYYCLYIIFTLVHLYFIMYLWFGKNININKKYGVWKITKLKSIKTMRYL